MISLFTIQTSPVQQNGCDDETIDQLSNYCVAKQFFQSENIVVQPTCNGSCTDGHLLCPYCCYGFVKLCATEGCYVSVHGDYCFRCNERRRC